ncbi:beta-ketoacyl-ACP synthase III [Risungbinella massiliensis]|uniref:beta-ketoacyl-ACP synthase III n=1 Tax=Risungbinella massiliensis TaxID=1329796 RepID=UPI0005CC2569|nr:beta-ketoacyl-ACP synthase III [Risungbinella massiliensis]
MKKRNMKIMGVGRYFPNRIVTAEEMDELLGVKSGWVAKKSGVLTRYFAESETITQMGALAAKEALEDAGLTLHDIDCIVSASGTMEQAIPCTAALLYRELGAQQHRGIPAFDINSTCLSFVTALDQVSYLIELGRYRHVLIVSSEIASVGLNWKQKESASLFGDGAAAVVVGPTSQEDASCILASRMETYPEGAHLTEIRGGGSKYHPRKYEGEVDWNDFLFDMDGEAVFRLSLRYLPSFLEKLFSSVDAQPDFHMDQLRWVVPHQASKLAMKIMQRRLKIPEDRMLMLVEKYGNNIAASIPIGLYEIIRNKQLQRGDTCLLLGTSAGLSLGGMVLVY